jgi:hypothetical protein
MENEPKELILVDLAVMQNEEVFEHKLFYEPVKPTPAMVAEKRCSYMANDEKYSLDGYSEHQRENWAYSKRIIIYENEAQLYEFIRNARSQSNSNKKMYFGIIPKNLAEMIKKDTGIDIESYNVSISENEIRKIFKSHGDEATELPRGQRAITEDDIVNIPKIIQNPDKIILDDELYGKNFVIKFTKTINGRTTVVSYASDKHQDLAVQTLYSGKGSGTLATLIDAKATKTTS